MTVGNELLDASQGPAEIGLTPTTTGEALQRLGQYLDEARQDPELRVLYESQVPVMEHLYEALEDHGSDLKGRIILPTGVGKTVLFTEFVRATGLRALVLTPTKLLLKQTEEAFGKFAGDDEIAVGKIYANEKVGDRPITITTYASFVRHTKDKDSPYIQPHDYDVLILDEAHQALGAATTKALEAYDHVPQIGLTATENYSEKRKLSRLLPVEIHNMSIKEAVESKLISPFWNWVVETETDMSRVKVNTTNEYDQDDLQRAINTEARNRVAADLYIKYFHGKKAIFACSGIEHAKAMAELLDGCGVPASAIHGGLSLKEQQNLKARFADRNPDTGLMVLCNDKILSVGFDEPSIEAAFNLAPTLSKVRSQQRSGRALRLDPQNPNKYAIIVEFTDENYRKPPVLFADEDVAGTAQLGLTLDFSDYQQTYTFNVASANVITNPEIVEQLASEFAEGRKDRRPIAPEGWFTMSALADSFNVPASLVRQAVLELKEVIPDFIEENSGKYKSVGVRDGITTYYSPAVREGLMEIIKEPEVAPEGWLTAGQVAARYGIEATKTRVQLVKIAAGDEAYVGSYVRATGTAKRQHFFSPDCVETFTNQAGLEYIGNGLPSGWISENSLVLQFGPNASAKALKFVRGMQSGVVFNNSMKVEEAIFVSPRVQQLVEHYVTPPANWKSLSDVAELLKVDIIVVQQAIDVLTEHSPLYFNANSRLCWDSGHEVVYMMSHLVENIAANVKKLTGEVSEAPIEFKEDTPVLIPQFEAATIGSLSVDKLVIRLPRRIPRTMNSSTEAQATAESLPSPSSYLGAIKRFKRR